MSYTDCRIGGVDVWVDPDRVTQNIHPHGQVVPALDGTLYVSYLAQNPANLGSYDTLQIAGMYAETSIIEALKEMSRSREVITVSGIPGIDELAEYYIENMSQSPVKPAVIFPGEDWAHPPIRHTYSMTLIKVTLF